MYMCCALVFCLCMMVTGTVHAAGYEIVEDETGLTGTYKGEPMQNLYVAMKESGESYKVVAPGTKGSEIYYFDAEGKGEVSTDSKFVKISYNGKNKEYYLKDGSIQTNQIVGNKKQGYYYVDSTGIKVTDKTTKLAVKFVRAHTKSTDSRESKLKKCYYYLSKKYSYTRYYTNLYPKAKSMQTMAYDMLSKKTGNCHRYAASFAYIATVLGYDARVIVGDISSNHGGMTPHGWTEVKIGKSWYIFDPDMEMNGVDSYKKTTTPCKTSVTRKCTMKVKNGKVTWK